MEIKLPYGRGEKNLRIPDGIRVDFLRTREFPPLEDLPDAFVKACAAPVGGPSLDEAAREAANIVIL
ncbi:MAG: hypothetical protein H6Q78_1457, partial [Candidatus Krumholzibacteriota bacterium]|nr:hypothetical protein [Candidatus Krumholzibacteriota bacterium]